MADFGESDPHCPRCHYNLRGLMNPRCPECGQTFPAVAWEMGILRDRLPACVDGGDPWQLHQLLLRSAGDLLHWTPRPRQLLTRLDADGPLGRAAIALVFGTLWLYIATTIPIAIATTLWEGVSPAAALRGAALHWSPRVLLVALSASILSFGWASDPTALRLPQPTPWHYLRLACFWLPACAAYAALPMALLLIVTPEFVLGVPYVFPMLTGLPAALAVLGHPPPGAGRRPPLRWVGCAIMWVVGPSWLANQLIPNGLEPPVWTYFL
jgi:hypothetical protein